MAQVEIRQARSTDILELVKIDHGIETSNVWQMSNNSSDDQFEVQLRQIKLPRSLKLTYPRKPEWLVDTWTKHTLFLVASCNGVLAGYLILDQRNDLFSAVIGDLVVTPPLRRQGIATALILSAMDWIKKRGATRLLLEIPAKNHPGIELARKLHFDYNGYIDHYYSNQDIALFYVNILK